MSQKEKGKERAPLLPVGQAPSRTRAAATPKPAPRLNHLMNLKQLKIDRSLLARPYLRHKHVSADMLLAFNDEAVVTINCLAYVMRVFSTGVVHILQDERLVYQFAASDIAIANKSPERLHLEEVKHNVLSNKVTIRYQCTYGSFSMEVMFADASKDYVMGKQKLVTSVDANEAGWKSDYVFKPNESSKPNAFSMPRGKQKKDKDRLLIVSINIVEVWDPLCQVHQFSYVDVDKEVKPLAAQSWVAASTRMVHTRYQHSWPTTRSIICPVVQPPSKRLRAEQMKSSRTAIADRAFDIVRGFQAARQDVELSMLVHGKEMKFNKSSLAEALINNIEWRSNGNFLGHITSLFSDPMPRLTRQWVNKHIYQLLAADVELKDVDFGTDAADDNLVVTEVEAAEEELEDPEEGEELDALEDEAVQAEIAKFTSSDLPQAKRHCTCSHLFPEDKGPLYTSADENQGVVVEEFDPDTLGIQLIGKKLKSAAYVSLKWRKTQIAFAAKDDKSGSPQAIAAVVILAQSLLACCGLVVGVAQHRRADVFIDTTADESATHLGREAKGQCMTVALGEHMEKLQPWGREGRNEVIHQVLHVGALFHAMSHPAPLSHLDKAKLEAHYKKDINQIYPAKINGNVVYDYQAACQYGLNDFLKEDRKKKQKLIPENEKTPLWDYPYASKTECKLLGDMNGPPCQVDPLDCMYVPYKMRRTIKPSEEQNVLAYTKSIIQREFPAAADLIAQDKEVGLEWFEWATIAGDPAMMYLGMRPCQGHRYKRLAPFFWFTLRDFWDEQTSEAKRTARPIRFILQFKPESMD